MQARVDWVLIIFGTQVIKKKRPLRSVFPDYTSVSHYYDLTGCSDEFKIVFKHSEESKGFSMKGLSSEKVSSISVKQINLFSTNYNLSSRTTKPLRFSKSYSLVMKLFKMTSKHCKII